MLVYLHAVLRGPSCLAPKLSTTSSIAAPTSTVPPSHCEDPAACQLADRLPLEGLGFFIETCCQNIGSRPIPAIVEPQKGNTSASAVDDDDDDKDLVLKYEIERALLSPRMYIRHHFWTSPEEMTGEDQEDCESDVSGVGEDYSAAEDEA